MEKTKILSNLSHKGFELHQLNDFNNTDYTLFRKDHINVILCHYIHKVDINRIEEEAKQLRNIMHKNKINAWNTYMLISFEDKIDFQSHFLIERSSKSMRRYVISNESDFNRIPFLDSIEVITSPLKISSETTVGSNEQIKKIIQFFLKHDGENTKIKSSTIQNNLNQLFDLEG
ncbi:ABC-three component system middle component 1 [Metabacillus sp. HB246100]